MTMNRNTKQKGGRTSNFRPRKKRAYETVGAGRWVAPIWKTRHLGAWQYGFTLSRMSSGNLKATSRLFRPKDILDLPKLTQVLAATLTADGCMSMELKQDLQCLENALGYLVGEAVEGSGPERSVPPADAIGAVVGYLEEEERKHYLDSPSSGHIYHEVRALRAWLEREGGDNGGNGILRPFDFCSDRGRKDRGGT